MFLIGKGVRVEALVDKRGLARVLKIKESTVGYYVRTKGLPYIAVGRHKRFNPEKVIKWFERMSQ